MNNLTKIEPYFLKYLPENKHIYKDEDSSVNQDEFMISEIIREKIIRSTN